MTQENLPREERPPRVLVVDDEPDMLRMIRAGLRSLGAEVTVFDDAEAALAAFRKDPHDAIVSDIMMPKMDGYTLLRLVRERDHDVPVILVTAFSSLDYAVKALKEGAYGFITKPFRLDDLCQNVKLALERRTLMRENQAYREELERKVERRTAELRDAHTNLEREHARREGYIAAAHFGFVALDLLGQVQFLNPQARALLGIDADDPTGQTLEALAREGLRPALQDLVDRVHRGDHGEGGASRIERLDRQRVLELTAYPVKDEGRITEIVMVAADVSEKTLLERQLRQSAKLASLGELAAGVAHEINNPVGFIGSNLSTLGRYGEKLNQWVATSREALHVLAESMPDVAGPYARHVDELGGQLQLDFILEDLSGLVTDCLQGVESVKNIVRGLKSFARADEESPQETNLNEAVLERAIALSHNEVKYKAEVVRDLGELPVVYCFPNALCQVFINLLVNGAHAIDGQGEIVLRSRAVNGGVEVEISDNGSGIPEEQIESIFDPFFTTKEVGVGTGLGLSLSYGIVQRHGGEIEVQSRPGGGTTFCVKLPLSVPSKTVASV